MTKQSINKKDWNELSNESLTKDAPHTAFMNRLVSKLNADLDYARKQEVKCAIEGLDEQRWIYKGQREALLDAIFDIMYLDCTMD